MGFFHDIGDDRLVQTFTFEGEPDGERCRRCGSKISATGAPGCTPSRWSTASRRDAFLRSGMETGINQGYAKLDQLLAYGTV